MRWLVVAGVVLILLGIVGLVVQVVPVRHEDEVAKVGPLTATQEKEHDVVIPPYAGIAAILVGGALVFAGRRRA